MGNAPSRHKKPRPGFPAPATGATFGTKPPLSHSRSHQYHHQQQQQKQREQHNRQKQRQQQAQAFRRKVASANKTAICTTTSQKVGRRSLRQLLDPDDRNSSGSGSNDATTVTIREAYIVPIFQRRYCWNTPQWDTLWHDIVKRKSAKHSLGRLTCTSVAVPRSHPPSRREGDRSRRQEPSSSPPPPIEDRYRSVIIDGQQRFTTVTLILAAIRDALVVTPESGDDNDDGGGEIDGLVRSIHRMLFLDPPAMERWVAADHRIREGLALGFCRLVPTFCDRSSYLAAILPPTARPVREFLEREYDPRWHRPLLAKRHFRRAIESMLATSRGGGPSAQRRRRRSVILKKLTEQMLDHIDMLYFPIDVDRGYDDGTEDPQVVYERLAIRDATWCKPRRSAEYRAMDGTDMIRNLLLGSFDGPDRKTIFYEHRWLPLERSFQTDATTATTATEEASGKAGDQAQDGAGLEATVRAFLDVHRPPSKGNDIRDDDDDDAAASRPPGLIGGRIYADFQHWMARDWDRWQRQLSPGGGDDPSSSSLPISFRPPLSPSEAHAMDVGRRLLDFARSHRTRSDPTSPSVPI